MAFKNTPDPDSPEMHHGETTYSSIKRLDRSFEIRMRVRTASAIKGFTHGRVSFDSKEGTIRFSTRNPLSLPDFNEVVREGEVLTFTLLEPGPGSKEWSREIRIMKDSSGRLYSPGIFKTKTRYPPSEGWRTRVYKYKAYFCHPGIETEPKDRSGSITLPFWLERSIERQHRFRSRLAFHCENARQSCRPVDPNVLLAFIQQSVIPRVSEFNRQLGHVAERLSLAVLGMPEPSIFALADFCQMLQRRERSHVPVPEGLSTAIASFLSEVPIDFGPIRAFEHDLKQIMYRERYAPSREVSESDHGTNEVLSSGSGSRRKDLQLRDWEWRPICSAFIAALKRRKAIGAPFYSGWPSSSDQDNKRWGIHFYLNNGGTRASKLVERGVRGLRVEPPVASADTGRSWVNDSRRARRYLCPARIEFRDSISDECWRFRFAVLLHRYTFPEEAVIKEWKLIFDGSGLWLYLVVQAKVAKQSMPGYVGAVHVGWRKSGTEIYPAVVHFKNVTGVEVFHRVVVETASGQEPTKTRAPLHLNMGPSRWGRRSRYWLTDNDILVRKACEYPQGIHIMDTWDSLRLLRQARGKMVCVFKEQLRERLKLEPSALQDMRCWGLHELASGVDEPEVLSAYQAWAARDLMIAGLIRDISKRVSGRLADGYSMIAHDICSLFQANRVSVLAIQSPFLASVARRKNAGARTEEEANMFLHSRANRQNVAPGLLVRKLTEVAEGYGIKIVVIRNPFISRVHRDPDRACGHENPRSAKPWVVCQKCNAGYDQDENAARNMVSLVNGVN